MEYLSGPVLGIETSCDETSVAVVSQTEVLANVVSSQACLHVRWGGIVPEAAARRHVEVLLPAINEALSWSEANLNIIEGIAVTNRPGLVGALSVGVSAAKALSFAMGKPFVGVHHLEAHILSPVMVEAICFPHVCLLVSGGHTELVFVEAPGRYRRLGGTIDDAAGEAFDKCARLLGLGYPGGPAIEKAAVAGDPFRYPLPKGLDDPTFNFSFAGLKTAVFNVLEAEGQKVDVASLAASFEETISSVLAERTIFACREMDVWVVSLVGGVAANKRLRAKMQSLADKHGLRLVVPPEELCTDNAAMIAHVGSWRLACSERAGLDLDTVARADLPEGVGN